MRALPLIVLLLAVGPACSDNNPNPNPTDSGPPTDTGVMVDSGTDGGTDSGAPRCGTDRPDVSGIRGTEGLVIGADGTIYYSQARAVGRVRPGMDPEGSWASLPSGASTVWGMVIDPANNRLFVGSPATRTIYAVNLGTGEATSFLASAGQPNGLTLGPDGALWYTDFGGGHVYRVDSSGTRAQVTTRTVSGANGLAFGPDGNLYVDSYNSGTLVRLTLAENRETGRETVASSLGSPDGLAFDARGRIYVTDNGAGRLLRLDADGSNPTVLRSGIAAAASVEFGAGALNCNDIYVASGATMVRFEDGDAAGANVPWHR